MKNSFPKVEFWGERRLVWEENTTGRQQIDYGYGIVECLCGTKFQIHVTHGCNIGCGKCHTIFRMSEGGYLDITWWKSMETAE